MIGGEGRGCGSYPLPVVKSQNFRRSLIRTLSLRRSCGNKSFIRTGGGRYYLVLKKWLEKDLEKRVLYKQDIHAYIRVYKYVYMYIYIYISTYRCVFWMKGMGLLYMISVFGIVVLMFQVG